MGAAFSRDSFQGSRFLFLWERHPAAILSRIEGRSHEKDLSLENSRDNADRPAPIISHVNIDPAADVGKLIDQRLLDAKLDATSPQREVLTVVDRFAHPTDRPFDLVSSPKDGAACEDAHNTAAFSDKGRLFLGYIYGCWFLHSVGLSRCCSKILTAS